MTPATPPATPARAWAAEALGTGLLVAVVVGSGIMAEQLSGDIAGLALLANALATGAILVVLISILAPVSGAHFNPVVTGVMAWRGALPAAQLTPYLISQCAGGALGAILANAMFDLAPVQIATTLRGGAGQFLSEAVATFALIGAILGAVRHAPAAVPQIVALTIVAGYWFTASTSFANPAVTLARGLSDTFAGIAPASIPGFVAAQIVGAGVAALVWPWLLEPARR